MSGSDTFYTFPAGSGEDEGLVVSTPATAGPWSEHAQHGGPPAALLARAIERLGDPGRVVGRFTMDLLGPVPVAPLEVSADVVRPGRSVALLEARLRDPGSGRTVATGRAWTFPAREDGPGAQAPLSHAPEDGHHEDPPPGWHRGYLDSVEWSWIHGAITQPGSALVWMRPRIPLVPAEEMSGLQRLLCCVDSASGASAALDPRAWNFLNTDLSVQVLRPPEGSWVCLDAQTTLSTGAVASATAEVYDARGLVARSSQTLLVVPANR